MQKTVKHENKTEYVSLKTQRFELKQSACINEGDFEEEDGEDPNPEFSRVFEALRRNEGFLLTMNEKNYEGNDESDSEDE